MVRSRVLLLGAVALLAGGAGTWLLTHRGATPTPAAESARTVFLSHILFSVAEQSIGAARSRAEAAYDLIAKGTPFGEVARAQSQDDLTRLSDGFAGPLDVFVSQPTAVHGAVQMLAEGQISRPIWTEQGWYVFQRHPYEEGRALERRWRRPCFAFRVTWKGLPGSADRTPEEAATLAQTITRDLRNGVLTFAEAKERFGVPDEGPPNGWRALEQPTPKSKEMFDRLGTVPEGGYPDPLPSRDGWIVIRRGVFFRSVVRHILVAHAQSANRDLRIKRSKAEAAMRAEQALAEAQADLTKWDHLVRSISDELVSVEDHGAIGCLAPGSLPPSMQPVEDALLATPPGRLYPQVVETPFGFHVVWRVD